MVARARAFVFGLLLLAASAAVLTTVFSAGYFPVQADETDVAWVAKQTAQGRVPYRDFFSFVPPLTVYGLGSFFRLVGPSLAALRFLSVAWLVLVTLLVYALLLRWRMPAQWAAGAAFLFPALYVPYWPVPSHHWFAAGFGLLAVLLVFREAPLPRHWFAAGLLAGFSGLCVQTEGAVFCLLLALRLVLSDQPRRAKAAAGGLAGVALPLLLFASLLAASGSLRDAYLCLIQWPAQYYKQSGGFNDVDPVQFLTQLWLSKVPSDGGLQAWGPLALLTLAYALPVLALSSSAWSPAWTDPPASPPRTWLFPTAGLALVALAYTAGREDWSHFVFWAPLVLVLGCLGVDWGSERWRPAAFKAWIALALALALLRWPAVWASDPPRLSGIAAVDGHFRAHSLPAVLSQLPEVTEKNLPVLYLSMQGSGLYFFWAPVPPPVDWLQPPSMRYNAPWEYGLVARFAEEHRVPFVLVPEKELKAFLEEPSALSALLRTRYRFLKRTPWGVVLERRPDGPPDP